MPQIQPNLLDGVLPMHRFDIMKFLSPKTRPCYFPAASHTLLYILFLFYFFTTFTTCVTSFTCQQSYICPLLICWITGEVRQVERAKERKKKKSLK